MRLQDVVREDYGRQKSENRYPGNKTFWENFHMHLDKEAIDALNAIYFDRVSGKTKVQSGDQAPQYYTRRVIIDNKNIQQ